MDFVITRIIEIFVSIPALLFQMLLILVLGGNMLNVILAIALLGWMELARLVRGQVLSWREREFIDAAQQPGRVHRLYRLAARVAQHLELGRRRGDVCAARRHSGRGHPQLLRPRHQRPDSQLGQDGGCGVTFANRLQQYWHLGILPAGLLSLVMLGFSFFGDALRDALDPRASR